MIKNIVQGVLPLATSALLGLPARSPQPVQAPTEKADFTSQQLDLEAANRTPRKPKKVKVCKIFIDPHTHERRKICRIRYRSEANVNSSMPATMASLQARAVN